MFQFLITKLFKLIYGLLFKRGFPWTIPKMFVMKIDENQQAKNLTFWDLQVKLWQKSTI